MTTLGLIIIIGWEVGSHIGAFFSQNFFIEGTEVRVTKRQDNSDFGTVLRITALLSSVTLGVCLSTLLSGGLLLSNLHIRLAEALSLPLFVGAFSVVGISFVTSFLITIYMVRRPKGNAIISNLANKLFADQFAEPSSPEEGMRTDKVARALDNKLKFMTRMNHELRTPLTAIIGFSDLLDRKDLDISQINQYAFHIKQNAKALNRVIGDILDLSLLQSESLEVQARKSDFFKEIEVVISPFKRAAEEKGLDFMIEFETALPRAVETDFGRLRQVLEKLLDNAVRFTDKGRVVLKIREVAFNDLPLIEFEIEDTGCGIDPKLHTYIFTPFEQVDNSHTRKFGGTGVGLTIANKLALKMGGDLALLKSQVDKGSTFCFSFDPGTLEGVERVKFDQTIDAFGYDINAKLLKGAKVLIVEDGHANSVLFKTLLEQAGAEVVVAENGKLGVEFAEASEFHLVFMDLQMPVMDGYQATEQLRKDGYKKPIIALTAHANQSERQRAFHAGCDDYLIKPIERSQLIATADYWYNKKSTKEKPAQVSLIDNHKTKETAFQGSDTPLISPYASNQQLRPIVETYVNDLPQVLEDFRETVKSEKWEEIRKTAHQLKGTLGSYGYSQMSEVAAQIEKLAKAESGLEDIDAFIDHLNAFTKRALEGLKEVS